MVAVKKCQWPGKGTLASLCIVEDFGGETFVIATIIGAAGRESIGMSLQNMRLFNLAIGWQPNKFYAKVVFRIIRIRRDLTPVLRDGAEICKQTC